jgi:glycosyltransferase involved in cell wall biosynthesis
MRVSAVIPCYNYGRYLARAIDSILAQTYPVSEIIVVDDGSTDNTREVALSYADRVRYIFQQNRGPSAARNRGIRAASGEWIAILDADDWWMPEKTELQLATARSEPKVVLVYCNAWAVMPDGAQSPWESADPRNLWPWLRRTNCVSNGSVAMIRRDVLLESGGFDESVTGCEDWDMWVRLGLKLRGPFARRPERLAAIHLTPHSVSTDPEQMLNNTSLILESTLLYGLKGWARWSERRRIWAVQLTHAAIDARVQGLCAERSYLWQSIRQWPSPLFHPRRWWALYRNIAGLSTPSR